MDAPSRGGAVARRRLSVAAAGLWIGAAALALGGLMIGQGWGTPFFVPGRGSGAMAFPLVIGWGLVAMSLLLLGRTLTGRDGRELITWPAGDGRRRALGLLLLGILYVVLFDRVGFLAANLLVGVGCLRLLGGYAWARSAVLAVVLALGLGLIFQYALGVSLPRGLVGI